MAFHGRDRITRIGCGDHLVPFSIVLTAFLTIIGQVEAGKIEAKSVSFADVSAAIGSAKDGDTVIVPTGTATWTTPLNITDNITLQGAGAGKDPGAIIARQDRLAVGLAADRGGRADDADRRNGRRRCGSRDG